MKDIKSYNELDDNKREKRNKLAKNFYDTIVILLLGFVIGFMYCAVLAGKQIEKENPPEYQEYMIEYLQLIMQNFHYAYNNTMYSYYESIANNIAIILHS